MGIRFAAAIVTIDRILFGCLNLLINTLIELAKQSVLQRKILFKTLHMGRGSELFVELRQVPDMQVRPAIEQHYEYNQKNDEGAQQSAQEQLDELHHEADGFTAHQRQISDSGARPLKNSLKLSHTPTPGSLVWRMVSPSTRSSHSMFQV